MVYSLADPNNHKMQSSSSTLSPFASSIELPPPANVARPKVQNFNFFYTLGQAP